jgi:REP element-mobilizing transposase RayT
MARRPRVDYPGGLYHVIARGNRRHDVFHDDTDRKAYLQRLQRYRDQHGFRLFAYVLMPNHVHLLIERQSVPLAKSLQGIQQSYTQYYNRRYATVGHAFQGRYHAILCDREAYWLALVRYIHLNPVRAKLVADPAEYAWSSHRVYLGRESSGLIEADPVLGQFASHRQTAHRKYQAFVHEAIAEGSRPDYYPGAGGDPRVLGGEEFCARNLGPAPPDQERVAPGHHTFEAILEAVATLSGVPGPRIVGHERTRAVAHARRLLVLVGTRCGIPGHTLARRLARDPGLISRMATRPEAQLSEHAERLYQHLQSQ